MDSFYEYLLKSYVLFEEKSDLQKFVDVYKAIKDFMRRGRRHCNQGDGPHPHYVNVNMESGDTFTQWIDSLQAAMPGLQVRTNSDLTIFLEEKKISIITYNEI